MRVQFLDSFCPVGLRQVTCHPSWHRPKLCISRWDLPYRSQHFVRAVASNQRP
jgi:hypothetical protein